MSTKMEWLSTTPISPDAFSKDNLGDLLDMKMMNGQPIGEKQIDAWVAEAENGYNIDVLRQAGRKPRDEAAAQVALHRSEKESKTT